MNIYDNALNAIYNNIIDDSENMKYTKMGLLPIYSVNSKSRILIIGQAPGLKSQTNETTWNDLSGDLLRQWLGVTKDQFYNPDLFGLLPMDFYFPGKGKTGDLPPRKGFADKWHSKILPNLKHVKLILLIGSYAQKYYLKDKMKKNLTDTVKAYEEYLPLYFPLSHPSPLNFRWRNKNPWFVIEVIPSLQKLVSSMIN